MKHIKAEVALALMTIVSITVRAQQYTYAHDATKMNQFMMQETGGGSIQSESEWYYYIMHNKYRNSIASTNKLSYRTTTYEASYEQVNMADSIRKRLENRAKGEAFNMADREVDVTWLTEQSKIENALTKYYNNLSCLSICRPNSEEMEDWQMYPKMWNFAIERARKAYMANSERQKEFLTIYHEIVTKNSKLFNRILYLKTYNKSKDIVDAQPNSQRKYSECATAAYNRWREGAWTVKANNNNLKSRQ